MSNDITVENRINSEVAGTLTTVKDVITNGYLCQFDTYDIAELPEKLISEDIIDDIRMYKIARIVSDKNESVIDKLVTVLDALYSCGASVFAIIYGDRKGIEYYLGVVCKNEEDDIVTLGDVLQNTFSGNFPGIQMERQDSGTERKIIKRTFEKDYISSVSGIPSIRNEKNNDYDKYVQGMEHLVDSLKGKEYSILVLADSVRPEELEKAITGYESIYTQLTPMAGGTTSINETYTDTDSVTDTEGFARTIGESLAWSRNYSRTSGWSSSISNGKSINASIALAGIGKNESISESFSDNKTTTVGGTNSENFSLSTNYALSMAASRSEAKGLTQQLNTCNKAAKDLLDKIDHNIERLQKCEAYGTFNCATYVFTSDPATGMLVSANFNALMRGDNSALQSSQINSWCVNDNENGRRARDYLSRFSHPIAVAGHNVEAMIDPGILENSYELAVNMALPKKSVDGLPVIEMASFARNVYTADGSSATDQGIRLGNVYHMGIKESSEVRLDPDSMASHLFVTGSTGAGKSNTIYQILGEAQKLGIPYLVIEPAKGEYKDVFGNESDVSVYGTNPEVTDMLKLNPFSFPDRIHIYEHMDRLVEIFNVCWPMYAAMPAVLKNAIEKSYEDCGWNLTESTNQYGRDLYPTFKDVSRNIRAIIDSSEYDAENKGAYKGSLLTRLQSLTNGINGQIFSSEEISGKDLFDKNVIVDLSRVGSGETKALLMGILVMKLQEYRMSSVETMNSSLRHLTVLEEAHNLLKRTSTDQPVDGGNLVGKSVEMLSNAIAEMRTYGEGFIIADQAPGLMDMSVIRNTNTKIIMRLPDQDDRELVGKAANLNDEQIKELAKQPRGVAAVYQNEWIQPILCMVDRYDQKDGKYIYSKKNPDVYKSEPTKAFKIAELLSKGTEMTTSSVMKDIRPLLENLRLPASAKVTVYRMLCHPPKEPRMTKLAPVMAALFPDIAEQTNRICRETPISSEWTCAVEDALAEYTGCKIDNGVRRDIVQSLITYQLLYVDNNTEALKDWWYNGKLR